MTATLTALPLQQLPVDGGQAKAQHTERLRLRECQRVGEWESQEIESDKRAKQTCDRQQKQKFFPITFTLNGTPKSTVAAATTTTATTTVQGSLLSMQVVGVVFLSFDFLCGE